jgi:chromate transporter
VSEDRTGKQADEQESPPSPDGGSRLREVLAYFTTLGVVGFGGPVAHIAMMERTAVQERGWVTHRRYLDAIAATNLVPGPNSTEVAIHLAYLRAGLPGAVLGGLAFILPAFFMLLALSWAYFEYETVPEVGDFFYGIKPAVVALILVTAYRLFLTGVGKPAELLSGVADRRLLLLFAAALVISALEPGWEVAVLLGAGVIGLLLYGPPLRLKPGANLLLPLLAVAPLAWEPAVLVDLAWLFLRTGALLFGGGYVMIPLLEGPVVEQYGWLTREQFLDGVALGQSTPGPIVITATFIGYGAAGFAGAAVATTAIFLPAFFFSVLASRFITAFGEAAWLRAFLKGIGAAVVGTILGATLRLAESAFVDVLTVAIGVAVIVLLLRTKLHSALLLLAGGAVGLAYGALR